MEAWTLLVIVIMVVAYWWESTRSQEIARRAAMHACRVSHAQILDDAVALRKWWLRRNPEGHIEICRIYFFEFTLDGEQRLHAYVLMFGHKVNRASLNIEDFMEG